MKIAAIFFMLLPMAFTLSQFTDAAKLNAVVYEPAANIRAWNCSICKELNQIKMPLVFTRQGLQGFVAYQSKQEAIVLVLRGTENPFDITKITNEDPEPYPYCNYCYVNPAIYRAWDTLRDDIIVNLQKTLSLFRQAKMIVFIGHSLGGAIVTLAIPQLLKLYSSERVVYLLTMGQPRVGNSQFSDYIQNTLKGSNAFYYRIVHNADPIPHLLPLGFYIHSPKAETWFDEQMTNIQQCYYDDKYQCSNNLKVYSNEDHPIEGYMK